MRRPRSLQFAATQRRAAAEELRQHAAAEALRRVKASETEKALANDGNAPLFGWASEKEAKEVPHD